MRAGVAQAPMEETAEDASAGVQGAQAMGFGLYPCALGIRVNVAVALTCLSSMRSGVRGAQILTSNGGGFPMRMPGGFAMRNGSGFVMPTLGGIHANTHHHTRAIEPRAAQTTGLNASLTWSALSVTSACRVI